MTAPVTAPVTAPTPPVTAAAATPALRPGELRVQVTIVPADAQVEIEGQPAEVSGGVVEIRGGPGSVKKVRVFQGAEQTTEDVVVTPSGPRPAKIELLLKGAKPAPKR